MHRQPVTAVLPNFLKSLCNHLADDFLAGMRAEIGNRIPANLAGWVVKESGKYRGYIGLIFPYSLLTTSKKVCKGDITVGRDGGYLRPHMVVD